MSADDETNGRDWVAWHEPYDDPASPLSRRLDVVRSLLSDALLDVHPGPVSIVSLCAGQGRDVIGVLPDHPRRDDVTARLVEMDDDLVATARADAEAAGLDGVAVVQGDAAHTSMLAGAVPAQIVMLCGIFGNVGDADVEATVRAAPTLCARDATVIWTRHRLEPDLTPTIRGWFADAGFEEVAWVAPDDVWFGVGAHRLVAEPQPFDPDRVLFRFEPAGAVRDIRGEGR